MARKLPNWLSRREDGVLEIDPDLAYPAMLEAIAASIPDPAQRPVLDRLDQYWVEVAYQCAKMHAYNLVAGTEYDTRPRGMAITTNIIRRDRWALKKHPKGRGHVAATAGREAARHYAKIAMTLLAG